MIEAIENQFGGIDKRTVQIEEDGLASVIFQSPMSFQPRRDAETREPLERIQSGS
jgi:hypothetical protein